MPYLNSLTVSISHFRWFYRLKGGLNYHIWSPLGSSAAKCDTWTSDPSSFVYPKNRRPLFSKQPPQKSAPSRVFQGQLSYLKMSTRPTEALGSIPAAQSFTSNASIIQTGPFEINNIKKHRSPSDFATSRAVLYHQLNIWLILSLVLVGSTLMFSLVFLVYRCRSSHSAGTHVNAKQVSHQPVSLSVASNQAKVEGATELDDSNVFPGDPVTLQSYHFAYNTLGSQNRATLKSASPTQCTFKRYPCTTTQYFSFPGPAAEPADTPV